MSTPKVSVLIPAFNEESNLQQAVESILRTGYRNLEIIIGIDGSEDRTLDIAKGLKKRYRSVSFVYHQKRLGTVGNVNSILSKARGEIILKFDADMRVGNPKKFFSNLTRHFEDKRIGGIAIVGYKGTDKSLDREIENKKKSVIGRGEYVIYELVDMFKRRSLPMSSVPDFPFDIQCFRRSVVPSIDKEVIHDDAFFAFKVLEKGYTIVDGSDVVIIHLGTPKSASGLSNTRIKGQAGWKKISDIYPIDMGKYYRSLIGLFLRNISKFSPADIIAFFCWSIIFSFSVIKSKLMKPKSSVNVWKKRT
jgi:glycosyltransferase involved in cell wall biosynthesis